MIVMASVSLQEGSLGTGYTLTWNFGIYPRGDQHCTCPSSAAR